MFKSSLINNINSYSGDIDNLKLSDTTAVVLAGGLGTRLRSVIDDRPKPMALVAGKPFLEYILNEIDRLGMKKVVICTGYMSNVIEEYFGNSFKNLEITYSEERMLLGTAGGLRFALPKIESENFLVMNGDSMCKVDLKDFFKFHLTNRATASMALARVPNTQRYGRVRVDDQKKISLFEEKGVHIGSGWINAGIYFLNKNIFINLPKGRKISLETEIFPNLLGESFFGYSVDTTDFIDIGLPESFERANRMFSHLSP